MESNLHEEGWGIVWIDLAGSYECINEPSVFHKMRGIS
jgi:hypothetical protein